MLRDNLSTLYSQFKLVFDARKPGGYWFYCRKCGAIAHSIEAWIPCQRDFVTDRVWCNECQNRWILIIAEEGEQCEEQST